MGFAKEEKSKKIYRGLKTLFFLMSMVASFLVFSGPLLVAIADTLLPSAIVFTSIQTTISCHFSNYDYRYSLIDIPLISIIRSAIIICVYSFCDGPRISRGPYLGITMICSVLSLIFVSLKASYHLLLLLAANESNNQGRGAATAMEIYLFLCSFLLAIGHMVVAYKTRCKERRKLLIYKIDIEAVSAYKNGLNVSLYQKILQQEQLK